MPRILFCDSSESWGGLQHWMKRVSDGMTQKGWTVEQYFSEGLERLPGPGAAEAKHVVSSLKRQGLNPDDMRISLARTNLFDLIVTGSGRDIRSLARTRRTGGIPIIWRVGGTPKMGWLHHFSRDRFVTRALVPSQYSRGLLVEGGWDPEHVDVIPNGIPISNSLSPDAIREARHALGYADDQFIILFVGSLRRVKQIDVLINAFAQVVEKIENARLIIVGTGIKRKELEQQAARLGLSDRVSLTGFQHEPSPYFLACDLFVLPSREETFGWVLLEAMMRGKPIVASAAGAIPEVVGPDEAALLVEPGNEDALAHAIQRALTDSELRQRLGDAGLRRVREHFTEAMMLDKLDAYFRTFVK